MSVIVRDDGFHKSSAVDYDGINAIWVEPDSDYKTIDFSKAQLISIHFPVFSDGRGFGIATEIMERGYSGRLRATGYLIADQYTMLRRVGFDEVEISDELAARQDESQWLARSNWQSFDYQRRLGQEIGA